MDAGVVMNAIKHSPFLNSYKEWDLKDEEKLLTFVSVSLFCWKLCDSGDTDDDIQEILSETGLSDYDKVQCHCFTGKFLSKRFDSRPTFLLTYEGDCSFILRLKPHDKDLRGVYNIKREYGVMKVLHSDGTIPVPKPYHYCSNTELIGTEFFVMEYVEGVKLDSNLTGVKPKEREKVYTEIITLLAKLHQLDVDLFGDVDSLTYSQFSDDDDDDDDDDSDSSDDDDHHMAHRSDKYWEWQLKIWEDNTGPMESLEESVYAKLKQCCPGSKLRPTHGDLNFQNIIFDKKTHKIKVIIDWEMSCIGDPLADIGNFLLMYLKPRSLMPKKSEPLRGKLDESLTEMENGSPSKRLLVDRMKNKTIPSEDDLLSQYEESFPGVGENFKRRVCFAKAVACLRWISILKSAADGDGFKGHESRLYPLLTKHPDVAVKVLLKAAHAFAKKC
jgi:aminoglycoside phosphotransferase (APT) family kinase protein